jgi:hypothetical protein
MPRLVGFGTFAALLPEQISEKISRRILSGDQGMIVWWSIGAGVHVEPHSHANEQIVWMLKGKMEFRLGSDTFSSPRQSSEMRYGRMITAAERPAYSTSPGVRSIWTA